MTSKPPVPTQAILCDASGRYAEDIVVPGGLITATNPTGKRESGRHVLPVIMPQDLRRFVDERAAPRDAGSRARVIPWYLSLRVSRSHMCQEKRVHSSRDLEERSSRSNPYELVKLSWGN